MKYLISQVKVRLLNFLIEHFLVEFAATKRQMSDGEYAAAMRDITTSGHIQTYLNITLANLIRRHLYIKDMEEHQWYLGQIAALRKLQTDAKRWEELSGVHGDKEER